MNLRIVRVDDSQYCDVENVEQVLTFYLVDTDVATHCCELTPSFFLWYLYTEAVPKEGLSEEEREALWEIELEIEEDGHYRHCRNVLVLPYTEVSHQPVLKGDPEPEGQEEEREVIEDCLEYYRANRCFI